jgi:hypothetical protein
MSNLEWFDGAPEKAEEGMVIVGKTPDGDIITLLIGYQGLEIDEPTRKQCIKWAWLIKPHELDWLASMATTHGKSRPEQ